VLRNCFISISASANLRDVNFALANVYAPAAAGARIEAEIVGAVNEFTGVKIPQAFSSRLFRVGSAGYPEITRGLA